jgi:predicted metal-dependent TIM-barrel fold hydrolase
MNRQIPIFLLTTTALVITSCQPFHQEGCGKLTNIIKKEIVDVELDLTIQYDTVYLVHTYKDGDYNVFETTQAIYDEVDMGAACVLIERDKDDIDDLVEFMKVRI